MEKIFFFNIAANYLVCIIFPPWSSFNTLILISQLINKYIQKLTQGQSIYDHLIYSGSAWQTHGEIIMAASQEHSYSNNGPSYHPPPCQLLVCTLSCILL